MSGAPPAPLGAPLDAAVYGGKAARLSAARAAGLPVPPGLALPAALTARLATGEAAAAERAAVAAGLAPFAHLPLAVRSSALGEDGAAASFAGQHVSYLNVRGPDAVYAAITAAWQAGGSAAARAYRARLGLADPPQVAVLIQQLVPADVAGVLFTRDPAGGADWVVEASWGLGEAVVSGLVTPDHYQLSPAGLLRAYRPGEKDLMVVPSAAGGTDEAAVADAARVHTACLDADALGALARLGAQCEALFGPGQDIEWAYAGPTLYLLQARPITTG
ncbi:MAG TPA: PEP/pyruvate-binding domain-containing protein [Chloroflexia bacterium]|nr:PEP/pyruvate-binding domain-containing protein [Chloroflexia bacterium]